LVWSLLEQVNEAVRESDEPVLLAAPLAKGSVAEVVVAACSFAVLVITVRIVPRFLALVQAAALGSPPLALVRMALIKRVVIVIEWELLSASLPSTTTPTIHNKLKSLLSRLSLFMTVFHL
jgi:hypothetical protein